MNELKKLDNVTIDCPRCRKSEYVKRNPLKEVVRAQKIKSLGRIKEFYCSGCGCDFNARKSL